MNGKDIKIKRERGELDALGWERGLFSRNEEMGMGTQSTLRGVEKEVEILGEKPRDRDSPTWAKTQDQSSKWGWPVPCLSMFLALFALV
jgi:hypothetical protein